MRFAVAHGPKKNRVYHYIASKDDARIVYYWLIAKRCQNVEMIEFTPIEDLEILRHMAIGDIPPLNRLLER